MSQNVPSTLVLPLNGLLDIQKNYLTDLGQMSGNTAVAAPLSSIQNKLNQLQTSFTNANISSNAILTHQSEVNDILSKERERLNDIKYKVDNEHYAKIRSIQLNDSYRKRQTDYIKIVLTVIVALVIYIVLSIFVPDPLYSILIVIVFSLAGMYCVNILWNINSRETTNHDRLDLSPPATAMTDERVISTSDGELSSNDGTGETCMGEDCCSGESRWDATMNKCIKNCQGTNLSSGNSCVARATSVAPSLKICGNACINIDETCGPTPQNPFSTLGEERIRTKHENEVKPYSPYEYSEYSHV
jgi:hypothetical protein